MSDDATMLLDAPFFILAEAWMIGLALLFRPTRVGVRKEPG